MISLGEFVARGAHGFPFGWRGGRPLSLVFELLASKVAGCIAV